MHPLEPLSGEEIKTAAALVKDGGHLGEHGRFSSITLVEPPKDVVLNGDRADREAVALVFDRASGEASSVVVSLAKNSIVSSTPIPGSQPAYLLEEMAECIGLVKSDPRWQEALRKRGVEDFDAVQCDPWPAGNFGLPDEDAAWLGLSLLSGAHMTLVPRVLDLLRKAGLGHVGVLVGGIIPEGDIPKLQQLGVAHVFGPGTALTDIVAFLRERSAATP